MEQQKQLEIASGLRDGDPDAWRRLFREFAPQVWRFVARRLEGRARSHVGDIVQETMMAAAKSAHGFDPQRGTLWSWMKGIATRQIALHYRKVNRQDRVAKELANEMANEFRTSRTELLQSDGRLSKWLGGISARPDELLIASETADTVRWAIAQLPEDYGELLSAKYLDEMTTQQIADRNGQTVASVHSKLQRARSSFREVFNRKSAGQEKP